MSESRVAAAAKPAPTTTEGMSYLSTLPQRLVRVYMPLALIVFVLLFPFYWMTMTAIKPKEHLLDLDTHNPFYTLNRPSSTSTTCCSRPTTRCGCGTRCSSPSRRPSCR